MEEVPEARGDLLQKQHVHLKSSAPKGSRHLLRLRERLEKSWKGSPRHRAVLRLQDLNGALSLAPVEVITSASKSVRCTSKPQI